MIGNSTGNGQLIAAVVVLVDAAFGLLSVIGILHTKPDESIVTIAVVAAFNIGGYVWAFIQHQQHVVKLQIAAGDRASAAGERAAANSAQLAAPIQMKGRR